MKNQPTLRNLSQPVLRRQRLGRIVLTLSSLLLINALFFAPIAYATATPTPVLSTPEATAIPTPPVKPTAVPAPPPRLAFAGPDGRRLAALAVGGLLLVSTVFIVRTPAVKARRRDEHDG